MTFQWAKPSVEEAFALATERRLQVYPDGERETLDDVRACVRASHTPWGCRGCVWIVALSRASPPFLTPPTHPIIPFHPCPPNPTQRNTTHRWPRSSARPSTGSRWAGTWRAPSWRAPSAWPTPCPRPGTARPATSLDDRSKGGKKRDVVGCARVYIGACVDLGGGTQEQGDGRSTKVQASYRCDFLCFLLFFHVIRCHSVFIYIYYFKALYKIEREREVTTPSF